MNVTTIFLGLTSLVLAVAFAFTIGGVRKSNSSSGSKQEIAELQAQIARLNAEAEALSQRSAYLSTNTPPPAAHYPAALPSADAGITTEVSADDMAEIERLRAELAEKDQEVEAIKGEKDKAEQKAEVANEEALWALGEKTKVDQRGERNRRSIENALTMGSVVAFNGEYGFLTFRPVIEREFVIGEKLAVRRNSGILCRATISSIGGGEISADVQPGFGDGIPEIQAGDDIILLPDYYDPPSEMDNTGGAGDPGIPPLPALNGGIEDIPIE